jgi:hypothetical protein
VVCFLGVRRVGLLEQGSEGAQGSSTQSYLDLLPDEVFVLIAKADDGILDVFG